MDFQILNNLQFFAILSKLEYQKLMKKIVTMYKTFLNALELIKNIVLSFQIILSRKNSFIVNSWKKLNKKISNVNTHS